MPVLFRVFRSPGWNDCKIKQREKMSRWVGPKTYLCPRISTVLFYMCVFRQTWFTKISRDSFMSMTNKCLKTTSSWFPVLQSRYGKYSSVICGAQIAMKWFYVFPFQKIRDITDDNDPPAETSDNESLENGVFVSTFVMLCYSTHSPLELFSGRSHQVLRLLLT